jgi:hypothetical protein
MVTVQQVDDIMRLKIVIISQHILLAFCSYHRNMVVLYQIKTTDLILDEHMFLTTH